MMNIEQDYQLLAQRILDQEVITILSLSNKAGWAYFKTTDFKLNLRF